MLETSVDILYISLSVGFLALIGFICYVLYRLGNLVFDFQATVTEVNHKLEMMDETINLANDSLRMANESLRGVLSTVDTLSNVANEASTEIQKVINTISGVSGLLTGLVDTLKLLKKK